MSPEKKNSRRLISTKISSTACINLQYFFVYQPLKISETTGRMNMKFYQMSSAIERHEIQHHCIKSFFELDYFNTGGKCPPFEVKLRPTSFGSKSVRLMQVIFNRNFLLGHRKVSILLEYSFYRFYCRLHFCF